MQLDKNILIADDDPNAIKYFSLVFKEEGYNVFTASDGAKGIDIINEKNIAVVIADLKMPKYTGIDILERAKQKDMHSEVIIITGQGSERDAADALRKGAYDYLTKPVEKTALVNKVNRAMEHREGNIAKLLYNQNLEEEVNERTAELEKSRLKYKKIITDMMVGFVQTNRADIIVNCNNYFAKMFGYLKQELIGKNIRKVLYFHYSDRDMFIKKVDEKGFVSGMDLVLRHKDGSGVKVEANAHMMLNDAVEYIGIEGFVHNITERKQLESDLKLQKAEYSNLFDNLAEGLFQTDENGKVVICNHQFAKIFGYYKEELIGQNVSRLFGNLYLRKKLLVDIKNKIRVTNYPLYLKKKNNSPVLVSVNAGFVDYDPNKANYIEGSVRDITQERTDAEISKLSHQLSSDAIYVVGFDQKYKSMNNAGCKLMGYKINEILGKDFRPFLHPDDVIKVMNEVAKKWKNPSHVSRYTFRVIRKDGSMIWAEVDSKFCTYLGEQAIIGFARDITHKVIEEKRKEGQKQELEEKVRQSNIELESQRNNYNAILDGLEEPVNIISWDCIVKYQNKKSIDLFGDGKGKKCHDVFNCVQEGKKLCRMNQILQSNINDYVYERTYENGTTFKYQARRFKDFDGQDSMLEIGVDLTGLLQKERKLFLSERLATVGKLAAEMAHELKQPLVVIGVSVPNIRRLLGPWEGKEKNKVFKKLNEINRQVSRAGQILDHVRGFSKDKELIIEKVNLQKVSKNALIFFGEKFKNHKIDLVKKWQKDLPLVAASEEYIEQIIVNIINNAHEAMNSKTMNSTKQKRIIVKTYIDEKKKMAGIRIFNNGVPIPKDIQEKLFEPFFSTKKDGIGLGLARSLEIVEQYRGRITFKSNNVGTTFWVEFPVVENGGI